MLSAWDNAHQAALALPDFESNPQLANLRLRVTRGDVVCPTCKQLLWLRAGEQRAHHFAHRVLADCPQARVSEQILAARRLIYRFFQTRVQAGKLSGPVELEPGFPHAPVRPRIDLLLRRSGKPPVAVVFVEARIPKEIRSALRDFVERNNFVFRPVFLKIRLKRLQEDSASVLLDTIEREWAYESTFGLDGSADTFRKTLHFIDPITGEWTSLRGLRVRHAPQVFDTTTNVTSDMTDLRWSEASAEWTHHGEVQLPRLATAAPEERFRSPMLTMPAGKSTSSSARRVPLVLAPSAPQPSIQWMTKGLLCVGCGTQTTDWQSADLAKQRCVCRGCFANGHRLNR